MKRMVPVRVGGRVKVIGGKFNGDYGWVQRTLGQITRVQFDDSPDLRDVPTEYLQVLS